MSLQSLLLHGFCWVLVHMHNHASTSKFKRLWATLGFLGGGVNVEMPSMSFARAARNPGHDPNAPPNIPSPLEKRPLQTPKLGPRVLHANPMSGYAARPGSLSCEESCYQNLHGLSEAQKQSLSEICPSMFTPHFVLF